MSSLRELRLLTRRVRLDILRNLHSVGGGHYGGSSSCVEILVALFAARPLRCVCGSGDRLLLSKGHASMALYAVLSARGPKRLRLDTYGQFGSPLQGHPDRRHLPELDFSFGSLGQGIAVGLGFALALRPAGQHVWVVLGDGECQEGMVWEAAMLAARYKLHNLHVVVDANGEQECGWGHDGDLRPEPVPDDAAKWAAFGWQVSERDGHDLDALRDWVVAQGTVDPLGPTVLLARTRKGIGLAAAVSGFRNHATHLTDDEFRAIEASLVGDVGEAQ